MGKGVKALKPGPPQPHPPPPPKKKKKNNNNNGTEKKWKYISIEFLIFEPTTSLHYPYKERKWNLG